MIKFQDLVKIYDSKRVIDGLNLEILPGEFVILIGASGAGKSTLVHALIGAERMNSGSIQVDGYRVEVMNRHELQLYRRKIGVIFQDFKLLDKKTVEENVDYALEVCGFEEEKIIAKTKEVLKMVGLESHAHKFPHQLSGGEKQRVAIARALVHEPSMIIADEPTGNLDPKTALEIIKLLKKINDTGITIILTTHNKELVGYIKKRVVKIENGKIVSDKESGEYI